MSKRLFITLRTPESNEEIDIELPGDKAIIELLPNILKILDWPASSRNIPLAYSLQTESGSRISPSQSLEQAGIENFDVLWIKLDESEKVHAGREENPHFRGLGSPENQNGEDSESPLPPPIWADLPVQQPCLVSDSGLIFILNESAAVIGRRSKEGAPQIDLSELDKNLICSRRHAEIVFTNGVYVLRGFNTRNGTLLNGTRLTPGEPRLLKDRDVLQFGFRGVELVFREAKQ